MGLYRGLIEQFPNFLIVGVDKKFQPHYPAFHQANHAKHFRFIQGDALNPPFDLAQFDFIWASPPCQAYMDTNKNGRKTSNHPRLIKPTQELIAKSMRPYVIENVYKAPINANVMLCGTMFGLRVIRHRYFECSFAPLLTPPCNHWGQVASGDFIGVYARGGKGHRHGKGIRDPRPAAAKVTMAEAMGIDWMNDSEITQAIPPAYSEYLIRQIFPAR